MSINWFDPVDWTDTWRHDIGHLSWRFRRFQVDQTDDGYPPAIEPLDFIIAPLGVRRPSWLEVDLPTVAHHDRSVTPIHGVSSLALPHVNLFIAADHGHPLTVACLDVRDGLASVDIVTNVHGSGTRVEPPGRITTAIDEAYSSPELRRRCAQG